MTQLQTARSTTCTASTRNVQFVHRRPPPRHALNTPSVHNGRALHVVRAKRASESDEAAIEEMKRAAEKGGILESSVAVAGLKVLAVAGAVGVVVILTYLAQPVIQNTIASFPSPGSS